MNVEKSNTPQEEELRARAQAEYDRLRGGGGPTPRGGEKRGGGGASPRREWTEATGGENGEKQTDGERQSIDSLVNSVSSQVATLVHDEVEYAKANVKAAIPKLTVGGVLARRAPPAPPVGGAPGAAAALTGIFAFAMILMTFVHVLAAFLPMWASFLIVGAVLLLPTGIFALLGGRKLKALKAHLASLSSLGANLAKDVAAIKNGMKK